MERTESTIKVKKTTLSLFNKVKGDTFKNQDTFIQYLLNKEIEFKENLSIDYIETVRNTIN